MKPLLRVLAPLLALSSLLAARPAEAEPPLPQPAIQLALDAGLTSRHLGWKDDLFGTLRAYSLPAAPIAGGELTFYPGAIFTRGRGAWIGIATRVESMIGVDSRRSQHSASLPTRAGSFSSALRLRAPLSFGAAWIDAGLAARSFVIGRAGYTDPDFPSIRFLGPRFGLGAELALPAHLALAARAGAAVWTSSGEIASAEWFPAARTWGLDAALRLRWALPRGFAPYVELGASRDILALHPQVGAARVAGGAAEDRLATRLGLEWTLGPPERPFPPSKR
ncbi:MAG: hypothetical protein ABI193_10620 [Minicystis sp.]